MAGNDRALCQAMDLKNVRTNRSRLKNKCSKLLQMNNKDLKLERKPNSEPKPIDSTSAITCTKPHVSSSAVMPCGSYHSCHHCNGYYFGCTWLERMTEDEYEKHEQLVIASR